MADQLERPIFSEGEILQAEDLNTAIDQARLRDSRHARQQHRWGIVQGLKLEASGGEITIAPGVAIDSRGREILVPAKERISPQAFPFRGLVDKDDLFPVFLIAVDEELTGDSFLGKCGGATSQRKVDSYELLIQRYREAEKWDAPDEKLLVTDGPDTVPGGALPRVLLGFVQWNVAEDKFTDAPVLDDVNYPRRFAGPRGNVWESNDANALVTLGPTPKGAQDVLTLQVLKSDKLQRLARFDQDGNLYILGELRLEKSGENTSPTDTTPVPIPTGDSARIVSGVASDGTRLPLPEKVTDEDISKERFLLHIFVRPIGLTSGNGAVVIECRVDESRWVRCLVREFSGTTEPVSGETSTLKLLAPRASSVEYLVIAIPKPRPS